MPRDTKDDAHMVAGVELPAAVANIPLSLCIFPCETDCLHKPMEIRIMAKKEELDAETLALINWCIEVEGFLVAGGATVAQAQDHIEEQIEWFTDLFYDGLTPEQAAKEALA
jgi:hypothetical protein